MKYWIVMRYDTVRGTVIKLKDRKDEEDFEHRKEER
jgi:hypothetical protein